MSAREQVERLLAEHGPAGVVNSREGWVKCICEARLQVPGGLDTDGYARNWDAEDQAWATHRAQVLDEAGLLAHDREARS